MRYRQMSSADDYLFGTNAKFLVDTPEAVAQAVRTRLRLLTGEWFLDDRIGLDKDQILGYGTQPTRDFEVQQRILGTLGVKSLLAYASSVENRSFKVTATIDTIFGVTTITEIL